MKFLANGPDIPDELLLARDAGDVILFCGAGVSLQSLKLPNFPVLADRVIQSLGAAQDSRARLARLWLDVVYARSDVAVTS